MTAYTKDFDETKLVFFDKRWWLEKHNEIWQEVKDSLKKEFDKESIYIKKYLKAKIKPYNGKINTNFHNYKIPKEDSQYICLSVILINSVFRADRFYYVQVFLEQCKYVVKEKKIPKYFIDDIEISSDSDKENSDDKNSDRDKSGRENSDEENFKK